MVALTTPVCDFGRPAPDFSLLGCDGQQYTLSECKGDNATLIMFICNHCPYVKAILPRLVADVAELQEFGVATVAIMSNDVINYPEDAPDKMQSLADEMNFSFPYLYDESQKVAKEYGAICTPDFFGYNKNLELQYRGRFDASGISQTETRAERELYNAITQIAESGRGPEAQTASIGCSIKWK